MSLSYLSIGIYLVPRYVAIANYVYELLFARYEAFAYVGLRIFTGMPDASEKQWNMHARLRSVRVHVELFRRAHDFSSIRRLPRCHRMYTHLNLLSERETYTYNVPLELGKAERIYVLELNDRAYIPLTFSPLEWIDFPLVLFPLL